MLPRGHQRQYFCSQQKYKSPSIILLIADISASLWWYRHDVILLLLSDAAPRIVKAEKAMLFYPKVMKIISFANVLHWGVEEVMGHTEVGNLVKKQTFVEDSIKKESL